MKAPLTCPLCGQKSIIKKNYSYCHNCQFFWLKKFPQVNYQVDYYQGKSSFAGRLFQPIGMFFYFLRRIYVGLKEKNIWLDIGAGDGGFLKTVKAKRKIGVEVSASGRKKMKNLGLEIMTEKEFLKKRGLNAEVISFWHVLEHVDAPWNYLKAAKKNLSQDGRLIVGIPNLDSFEFRFFGQHWFHLQPQFHLWHFSTKAMKKLLKKTGFQIKKVDYCSIEHHFTGVLQSFINWTSGSNDVLHKLIKRQAGFSSFKARDVFWSLFWLTLGLPLVFLFWVAGSLWQKSGTIVLVACQENTVVE